MPHVEVTSSTGNTRFKYTICTPTDAEATTIDPSLPTLLFIHPVSIAEHVFHAQFADPLLRCSNLVSFDLRGGHGDTSGDKVPPYYGQVEAAEDTIRLMDALELPACHLVGMSTGTIIATQLAVTYPDRVLSLFLVSHLCLEIPPEVADGHLEICELWTSAFPDASTVLEDVVYEAGFGNSQYMFSTHQVSPLVTAMMKITYPVAMEKWGYEHLDQFRIMNLDFHLRREPFSKTSLARIAGSVKIVHGTEDVAYPQSYSREFLRRLDEAGVDASMHVVRGAPHYLLPDFSNQINPVLYDFILQNDDRLNNAPVPDHVQSPWTDVFKQASLESEDSLFDDCIIIHPRRHHHRRNSLSSVTLCVA
ncbi:Alpha/Beta hydrolase protein [Rhodocollybia butyracea]|uniref:Alpha/Beta hydrolase protein n=1 Tax=Rhodocollybia butyracea TaxID=206335 RepID=A0A9P5PLI8_9AGAR|nr:Alpha/Beta hydrolase protein [Rhodocollybia butyracea]